MSHGDRAKWDTRIMSWTAMKIGLPNTAAIIALAMVPLFALISESTRIESSGAEPVIQEERANSGNTMLLAEGASIDTNVLH